LSPSSVDLTWYTTDEALNCNNLTKENYRVLSNAFKSVGISLDQESWLKSSEQQDIKSCIKLAEAVTEWKNKKASAASLVSSSSGGSIQSDSTIINTYDRIKDSDHQSFTATTSSYLDTLKSAANQQASNATRDEIDHDGILQKNNINTTNDSSSTSNEPEYEPSEISFITNVRWLLQTVMNFGALEKIRVSFQCFQEAKEMEETLLVSSQGRSCSSSL
jgi:hypothetical protein